MKLWRKVVVLELCSTKGRSISEAVDKADKVLSRFYSKFPNKKQPLRYRVVEDSDLDENDVSLGFPQHRR